LIVDPFYKIKDVNSTNYRIKDDSSFLQILPQQDLEDKLHYLHIARISGGEVEFLSQGQLSVLSIAAWKDTKVYFEATKINDPGSRHLYVADTIQKGKFLKIYLI
jgi:hypothetical protein